MFQIVSWTKTQNLMYIILNRNVAADDFQNSLDQATLNSILSDLVDTSSGIEYEAERDKNYHIVCKIRDILMMG